MDFQIRTTNGSEADRLAIRNIFFQSSERKDFVDEKAKDEFYSRWTDFYLNPPAHETVVTLVAEDSKQKILAYLTGCADSQAASAYFAKRIPSYQVFEDLFALYPAHLHINALPEARGIGIGSELIHQFCIWCQKQNLSGVHIVTSPNQRNASFYRRNLFVFETERPWKNQSLLFMGRKV